MLQENVDICAPILTEIFNDSIKNGTFVNELELVVITPISCQLIVLRRKTIDQSAC